MKNLLFLIMLTMMGVSALTGKVLAQEDLGEKKNSTISFIETNEEIEKEMQLLDDKYRVLVGKSIRDTSINVWKIEFKEYSIQVREYSKKNLTLIKVMFTNEIADKYNTRYNSAFLYLDENNKPTEREYMGMSPTYFIFDLTSEIEKIHDEMRVETSITAVK